MDISTVIAGFEGVKTDRRTLASTSVWYEIPIPSEEVDKILIYNEDDANGLRVAILEDSGTDPNRVSNFATTYGYLTLTGRTGTNGWIALSADLSVWLQPITTNQAYFFALFSKKKIGSAMRRDWLKDTDEK